MKDSLKIVYMDGYDEVRYHATQSIVAKLVKYKSDDN